MLDPLLPPEGAAHVFERLNGAPAFGPRLFFRGDAPQTELHYVDPGAALPGDVHTLYDGRGRNETPLWFPQHQTIVFADALNALDGELRIWTTPWRNHCTHEPNTKQR